MFNSSKFVGYFSPTLPSGPSWSSSQRVCLCVCLSVCLFVPFQCDFCLGLSLVPRSHDEIPASHWSNLLPYHIMVVVLAVWVGGQKPLVGDDGERGGGVKKKINHATSSNLYRLYYPNRSRELVSPVCGIFILRVLVPFPQILFSSSHIFVF